LIKIGDIKIPSFPLLLAPMEDVSDPPFRALCKEMGADVVYTEFISSEGLIRNAHKSVVKLDIFEKERPVGIQIFGANLESMLQSIDIVESVNPDIIDINYGCPVKNVACKGAGAGILQDIPKMVKMTAEIVKAVDKPVTVKTRLGWDDSTKYIVEVAERLQDIGIQAISIHGRTRKQMYKGEADWSLIAETKNNPRLHIPVFGNGDVDSGPKALEYRNKYGVDGIMIGRASIGYPWIFDEIKHYFEHGVEAKKPTVEQRVAAAREHFELSLKWKEERYAIMETRKHYTNYFRGLSHFKPYRTRLVTLENPNDVLLTLDEIESEYIAKYGNDQDGPQSVSTLTYKTER